METRGNEYQLKLNESLKIHQEDCDKIKELNQKIDQMSETSLYQAQEKLGSEVYQLTA